MAAPASEAVVCAGCPAVAADVVLAASADTAAVVECAVAAEGVADANSSDQLPPTTTSLATVPVTGWPTLASLELTL